MKYFTLTGVVDSTFVMDILLCNGDLTKENSFRDDGDIIVITGIIAMELLFGRGDFFKEGFTVSILPEGCCFKLDEVFFQSRYAL